MEIALYFYGCNCGCTPGTNIKVNGEKEDVIRAGADLMNDYRVHGKTPYRKVDISGDIQQEVIEVKAHYFWDIFETPINAIIGQIQLNTQEINKLKSAADDLEITLPPEITTKIDKLEKENTELNNKKEQLEIKYTEEKRHFADVSYDDWDD